MATKIIHKKSSVADRVPLSTDLEVGELALNLADQKIYSKQTNGTVVEMSPQTNAIRETAKNVSGASIAAGTPVYQSGVSGNAVEIQPARADTASSMPALGLLRTTLADQAEGEIVLSGLLQGIDTSSFSAGDSLYVDATGGLTNTAPTGSANLIQNIGKVVKVHASNGSIMVTGAGRSNATPNLDDGQFFIGNASNQASTASFGTSVTTELGNNSLQTLSDVDTDATPSNGDILVYNSTDGEWKTQAPSSNTVNDSLTNWELDSGGSWNITETSNNLFFEFGGTNYMKIDASGNLLVTGDVTSNATISGGNSASLYFKLSGTNYMELTTSGNLLVAADITSNATI